VPHDLPVALRDVVLDERLATPHVVELAEFARMHQIEELHGDMVREELDSALERSQVLLVPGVVGKEAHRKRDMRGIVAFEKGLAQALEDGLLASPQEDGGDDIGDLR